MSTWPRHSCQLPDGRLTSSTIFLVWTCIGSFLEPNTFVFGKINLLSYYFQVLISLYLQDFMFVTPLPPLKGQPMVLYFQKMATHQGIYRVCRGLGRAGCIPVTTDLRFFELFIFVVFWAFISFKLFLLSVIEYFCQILLHLNVLLDI